MTLSFERQAQLAKLIDAVCGGTITPEQAARLERELLHDGEAQWFYLRYIQVHGTLLWDCKSHSEWESACRLKELASIPSPCVGDEQQPVLPRGAAASLPLGFLGSAYHGTVGFFSQELPLSLLITTVIMGMMLLGAWAYKITPHQHFATAPSKSVPSDARPEMVFVGRITGLVDVKWSDDPYYLPPMGYAHVSLGRKYKLDSGLMEITYDTGAKVILQGPCTYEVESTSGGYLALGKLTARVEKERSEVRGQRSDHYPLSTNSNPQSLIPNPLFSVRTPTAIVTDLGTEFGVEVKPGMGTEVHVFQGKVEAEWIGPAGASGKKVQLIEGKAAKFDRRGVVAASFVSQAQGFPSIVVPPRVPVDVAAHKLIVKCSGTFGEGDSLPGVNDIILLGMYRARNVNDGMTDETVHGDAYWLGRNHTANEYFTIDLRHRFDVERIELMNTHNSIANDRGTEDFEIWAGDEIDQYCELIAPRLVLKGTLPCRFGAGAKIPFDVFSAAAGDFQPFRARYVKFVAKTHYCKGEYGGCGLNEIRVFATPAGNKQRGISPADTTKNGKKPQP
ncbi:MAG: FecR family protein [Planctomycetes bacterium]|nr:FecR family protein [Planctomycetota bacterium]MCG2682262.1 FecR family protein [Planctomycetales bacterium]